MFPRIMHIRCHFLLLLLVVQIILLVWFFSKRHSCGKSVLCRLENKLEPASGPGILHLTDDSTLDVLRWYGADVCIKEGSSASLSSAGHCVCLPGWGGKRCGLPQSVLRVAWMAEPTLVSSLQVRKRPRRILMIISEFFYDFYLLELNVRMLADLVDVFIVGENEAKYVMKNESLLAQIKGGYLKEYHDKIVYVNMSKVDALSELEKLHFTADVGLRLVSDIRIDDVLLFASAEHIYQRKFVLFIKLFHNYPQPIRCEFDNYLYGFYWKVQPMKNKIKINAGIIQNSTKVINKHFHVRNKRTVYAQPHTSRVNIEKDHAFQSNQSSVGNNDVITLKYDNRLFAELYGDMSTSFSENSPTAFPSICALSVHLFANVFENKVIRLHEDELLFKPSHIAFFDLLEQPVFPWTYSPSGWTCHLCTDTPNAIYEKLFALPASSRPKWFDSSKTHYLDMLAIIAKLKSSGKDEYLVKARVNKVHLEKGRTQAGEVPSYAVKHMNKYASLLSHSKL